MQRDVNDSYILSSQDVSRGAALLSQDNNPAQDHAAAGAHLNIVDTNDQHYSFRDLPTDIILIIFDFTIVPMQRYLKRIFFAHNGRHQISVSIFHSFSPAVGPGLNPLQFGQLHVGQSVSSSVIPAVQTQQYHFAGQVPGASSFGSWNSVDRVQRSLQEAESNLFKVIYGIMTQPSDHQTSLAQQQSQAKRVKREGTEHDAAAGASAGAEDDISSSVPASALTKKRKRGFVPISDQISGLVNPSYQQPFAGGTRMRRSGAKPVLLFRNLDFSILSNTYQDHEQLTTQMLMMLCCNLVNCRWVSFRGHTQLNNACVMQMLRRSSLQFIDLANTKVDSQGLELILRNKNCTKQLKTLKLTWLMRSGLQESQIELFQNTRDTLKHLEIVNNTNTLKSNGVAMIAAYCKQVTYLNLSRSSLRDDQCFHLLQMSRLQYLFLDDCEITNAAARILITTDDMERKLRDEKARGALAAPAIAAAQQTTPSPESEAPSSQGQDGQGAGGAAAAAAGPSGPTGTTPTPPTQQEAMEKSQKEYLEKIDNQHMDPNRAKLVVLSLSNNTRISSQGITNLRYNASIRHLYLNDTSIGDDALESICNSHQLTSLSIEATKISAQAFQTLVLKQQVQQVLVDGRQQVEKKIVRRMPHLKKLNVRHTVVHRKIVADLKAMLGDTTESSSRIGDLEVLYD